MIQIFKIYTIFPYTFMILKSTRINNYERTKLKCLYRNSYIFSLYNKGNRIE